MRCRKGGAPGVAADFVQIQYVTVGSHTSAVPNSLKLAWWNGCGPVILCTQSGQIEPLCWAVEHVFSFRRFILAHETVTDTLNSSTGGSPIDMRSIGWLR